MGGDCKTCCVRPPGAALSLSARRCASVALVLLGVVAWLVADGDAWSNRRHSLRPTPPGPAPLLWEDRFGQPGRDEFPLAHGIAATNKALFVVGAAQSASGDHDFLVRAYSAADGRLLWAEDVFDRAGGRDEAIGVTSAGEWVYAVGGANIPANLLGIPLVRAYDSATGHLLWHHEFTHGRGFFGRAVVHKDTVVAVGGNTTWLVQAYHTETGAVQWEERFGVGTNNRATSVAAHAGRVFVSGRAWPPGAARTNWFVRAYDASSGHVLWDDHAPDSLGSSAFSIAVEGSRVIAVGNLITRTTTRPFVNVDWRIRAYDAKTGALLWQDVVDKGGMFAPEIPLEVTILDGRAFVVGGGGVGCQSIVIAPDNCDFIVRAYELESGQLLWEDQLDRGPFDLAVAVTARDGKVFALGLGGNQCDNSGQTNCDIVLRVYEAQSGTLLWEDQVDSMGTDDTAQGVAASGGEGLCHRLCHRSRDRLHCRYARAGL